MTLTQQQERYVDSDNIVQPLGVFGVLALQEPFQARIDQIEDLRGLLPSHQREVVADYLRSATIIFAIMEQTTDILGKRFSVAGGSAIMTDGSYYWRLDTAEYVSYYGVGLPIDFLASCRSHDWKMPRLSSERITAIDTYLYANIVRSYDTC